MEGNNGNNGWNEWSKFVLKELERLNGQIERISEKIESQNNLYTKEITNLKIATAKQGAIWGFIAGAIPVIVSIVLKFI